MNSLTAFALLLTPPAQADVPQTTIRMQAAPLEVGAPLELVVRIDGMDPRWLADRTAVQVERPILQIDAPDGVELIGAPIAERVMPIDFETNYLRLPYGRKLVAARTPIAFELTEAPAPDARIAFNLVYWLDNDDAEKARFVRQRFELALVPGAEATPADASVTNWGGHGTLNVGDTVDLTLPSHDGFDIELDEFRGGPVLIVTYRAHW